MRRNLFENNEVEVTPEEALALGSKVNSVLPTLDEGYHYELTTLSNGRVAVVVEQDQEPSGTHITLDEIKRDRFGRKYAE